MFIKLSDVMIRSLIIDWAVLAGVLLKPVLRDIFKGMDHGLMGNKRRGEVLTLYRGRGGNGDEMEGNEGKVLR